MLHKIPWEGGRELLWPGGGGVGSYFGLGGGLGSYFGIRIT